MADGLQGVLRFPGVEVVISWSFCLSHGITPSVADPHLAVPLVWVLVLSVLLFKPSGLWGAVGLFGAARARDV